MVSPDMLLKEEHDRVRGPQRKMQAVIKGQKRKGLSTHILLLHNTFRKGIEIIRVMTKTMRSSRSRDKILSKETAFLRLTFTCEDFINREQRLQMRVYFPAFVSNVPAQGQNKVVIQ